MLEFRDIMVRINRDEATNLWGWVELKQYIDGKYAYYWNNIRLKKKEVDGKIRLVMEYPHKVIIKDGEQFKKYYFKPINKDSYSIIERPVIAKIYEKLKELHDKTEIVE